MRRTAIYSSIVLMATMIYNCENFPYKRYPMYINNYSHFAIGFYPAWGGKTGVAYPDTTLSFYEDLVTKYIASHKIFHDSYGGTPLEERIRYLPKDTLSIYFFAKDTLDQYDWTEIQSKYNVLIRYDLSMEDLYVLYNKYGIPEIPYPPTSAMRHMKMYPPYGQ